jgi:hypothetical protein
LSTSEVCFNFTGTAGYPTGEKALFYGTNKSQAKKTACRKVDLLPADTAVPYNNDNILGTLRCPPESVIRNQD